MSTLNYIDENGNINKAGVIPKNYPASNIGYNNSQSGLSADNVQGAIDELKDNLVIEFVTNTIESSSLTPDTANTYQAPIPTKAGYTAVMTWFVGMNSTIDWTNGITNIIPHSNGRNISFIPASGISVLITFAIMYVKVAE